VRLALRSIAAVGALSASLLLGGCTSQQHPVFLAPHGYHLTSLQGFAVVERNDRTLVAYPQAGPCGLQIQNRLLAIQTSRGVRLALAVENANKHEVAERCQSCGHIPCMASSAAWPGITLARPLSSHSVVDDATGRPILVYGAAEIVVASVLPAGCKPRPALPDDYVGGPPQPEPYQSATPTIRPGIMWTCRLPVRLPVPDRSSCVCVDQLQVGQWLGHAGHVGWPVKSYVEVQHRRAALRVAEDGGGLYQIAPERESLPTQIFGRSLSWYENGETFVVTSTYEPDAPLPPVDTTRVFSLGILTTAQLQTIANGLRIAAQN
jgi:hypothetical protein